MQTIFMSPEKNKELGERLAYLKRDKAREIAEEIEVARSHGDLSENSEYKTAKENQDLLLSEIESLEEQLSRSKIIKKGQYKGEEIFIGSNVKVFFVDDKEEETYEICGIFETDPKQNRISNESPIGKALWGKKKGDRVAVNTPGGSFFVEIRDVK